MLNGAVEETSTNSSSNDPREWYEGYHCVRQVKKSAHFQGPTMNNRNTTPPRSPLLTYGTVGWPVAGLLSRDRPPSALEAALPPPRIP